MNDAFVAIDLETTGFDPTADRIIEIGAVRFDRNGGFERYRTFVRPDQPIPAAVQALTSIREADVANAPRFSEVLPVLARFVEGRTVVGHNVQFDLGFLAAEGLPLIAQAFDTYDLASALLPTANRMNLGAIAEFLEVPMPVAHRALADAEATASIFVRLLARLDALPRSVLLDLRAIAEHSDWAVLPLLVEACARANASPHEIEPPRALSSTEFASFLVAPAGALPAALVPAEELRPVMEADVDALFALASQRPDLLGTFEPRQSQRAMARAVARNIQHAGHLAVEAGTGTGKSLAYLLPSLLHALRNDDRVVVSTHTLNLQEQLALKDMPGAAAVVETFAGVAPGSLRTAVLKGRSNYLCLERWAEARATLQLRNQSEARLHARIAVWLPTTETGELGEIAVPAAERSAWDALSSASNDCLSRRCAYVRDNSCFLLRARARAAAAHLVVVNHALLLANAASGDQVLPPYRHLVVDEAHRLEGVATQAYGSMLALRELTSELERTSTVVSRMRELATGGGDALSPAAGLVGVAEALAGAAASALVRVPDLEMALRTYVDEFAEGHDRTVPITAGRRAQPLWDDVEEAAAQLDITLQYCADRIGQARAAVNAIEAGAAPAIERLQGQLGELAEAVFGARSAMYESLLRADSSRIVWLTDAEGGPRAHAAPLEVAGRLASDLYAARDSVTATSATLTAQGTFDYSIATLGLVEPDTLTVPSPFDYRRAVLALVVDDIPTPEQPGYADALHRVLGAAATAAGGRTLGLFTSHAAVRAAAGALSVPLASREIGVLAHQLDGSPARLLRQLVEQPRTLLLGTAAFWEGVDVRGDALSQIAIARLPFPVPNDPIYSGRAELFDDPFSEFALPQAVLRFRQGFGRLIRGTDERGVFLLLDRRVLTRPYGEAFLDALPDCEVRRVPASAVADHVSRWLQA